LIPSIHVPAAFFLAESSESDALLRRTVRALSQTFPAYRCLISSLLLEKMKLKSEPLSQWAGQVRAGNLWKGTRTAVPLASVQQLFSACHTHEIATIKERPPKQCCHNNSQCKLEDGVSDLRVQSSPSARKATRCSAARAIEIPYTAMTSIACKEKGEFRGGKKSDLTVKASVYIYFEVYIYI